MYGGFVKIIPNTDTKWLLKKEFFLRNVQKNLAYFVKGVGVKENILFRISKKADRKRLAFYLTSRVVYIKMYKWKKFSFHFKKVGFIRKCTLKIFLVWNVIYFVVKSDTYLPSNIFPKNYNFLEKYI